MVRHFLTLKDYTKEEFFTILENALKSKRDPSFLGKPLADRHIGLLFEKPSTRTRISYEVGVNQLGGYPVILSSKEIQLSRGESTADTARVLSRYLDGIMIRTFSHTTLEEFVQHSSIPVINGLSDLYHPSQILADFLTILENGKKPDEISIAFVGDGASNVANSLAIGAAVAGATMRIIAPRGHKPDSVILDAVQSLGGKLEVSSDPKDAEGVDVIYTDVWVSMGQEKEAKKRKKIMMPYQIDEKMLSRMKSDGILLHCLPAHKGEEITAGAFESEKSRIFDQAENRLHAQKALLHFLFS